MNKGKAIAYKQENAIAYEQKTGLDFFIKLYSIILQILLLKFLFFFFKFQENIDNKNPVFYWSMLKRPLYGRVYSYFSSVIK